MTRVLSVLLALAVCAGLAAPATTATIRTVKVGDNYFVRDGGTPTVTVTRDTRVRWRWSGNSFHDVTVVGGPVRFKSRAMDSGSYTRRMTRRGTYRIVCKIHGGADQSMTLRVR